MKFRCKKDIELYGFCLAKQNDIVMLDQILESGSVSIKLTEDFVDNLELFEPINQVIMNMKEFEEGSEEIEKEWIVEIKVKTTRSRLRKLEEFIHSELPKFLN